MGKMKQLAIELEDDWGELQSALEAMAEEKDDIVSAVGAQPEWYGTIGYYVPRLIKAWNEAYKLCEDLIALVARQKEGEGSTALYVPPGGLVAAVPSCAKGTK